MKTRADLAAHLATLLGPLEARFTPGDAGFHLGETAAHYPFRMAALEGFSRVLWGLAPLLAGGGSSPLTDRMVAGLAHGTDPAHPAYWGVGGDRDQRQVEMAAMALALLLKPEVFWDRLDDGGRDRLASWLGTINAVELPPTNWEFFRVLVNLALKTLGRPHSADRLAAGLGFIDALYRDDGWYIDETNYDLYNPFAFHFYGLVYARFQAAEDPERCARFRRRARQFAGQFVPWFAGDGSIVAQGRSLTYRFAAASFFSACAFAGEEVLPWGVLKGLVLRHLRWWFDQPILDTEGLLTIGYRYPNLILAEQYNSPGSPYWALKTYLVLALPAEHPFWTSAELPLPSQPSQVLLPVPRMLVARDGGGPDAHVWLLNGGQYPCWESVQSAAKYAKFAYSNRFGFCVSHGGFDLGKTGADSTLLLSEGDGYWRERRHNDDRTAGPGWVHSRWCPWADVVIDTWLVAAQAGHVRLHRIVTGRRLETAEGGFSLPDLDTADLTAVPRTPALAGEGGRLTAVLPWAWGAVADLAPGTRKAELHKPEPNLNVLYPKVLVPLLRVDLPPGTHWLVCQVDAGWGPVPRKLAAAVEWSDGLPRVTEGTRVLFTGA